MILMFYVFVIGLFHGAFTEVEDDFKLIESIRHNVSQDYNYTIHSPIKPYEEQDPSILGPYNYSQFQPLPKIESELRNLVDGKSDDNKDVNREMFSIGKTFEGRDIWAIKVQDKSSEPVNRSKDVVLIECGAHAREWISVSTCMYLIRQFSRRTDKVKPVLARFDWVFIPVLNPDGYDFTWFNKSTRNWRKNRSINPKVKLSRTLNDSMVNLCIGTDINRNFDVMWGGLKAPKEEPCDIEYPGEGPFSEKESSSLANYVTSMKHHIIAYFSLHTYSLKWAMPWAHQKVHPSDYDEMKRVADIAVESIKHFAGISYMVGSTHDILYPTSGTSTDWVYAKAGVVYTYLVEMIPAKGKIPASFMLPPDMMLFNAQDMLQGIVAAATEFKMSLREKKIEEEKTDNKRSNKQQGTAEVPIASPLTSSVGASTIVCNVILATNLLVLYLWIVEWYGGG